MAIPSIIVAVIAEIPNLVFNIISKLVEAFPAMIEQLWYFISDGIVAFVILLWEGIKTIVYAAGDFFASIGGKVWDAINDIKGEYAITNHAYGIGIDDDTDISLLTSTLNSDKFNEFLTAIKWEPREIEDYTLKLLNKNFYKML
jgi:hypothetical protein